MKRNRYTFGIGTIGRDMLYTLISMFFMFYLTDVLSVSAWELWWMTGILVFIRVFDAITDPVMGVIVDNTKSRFGKYKPWIAVGAFSTGFFTILLFYDYGLSGRSLVIALGLLYFVWSIAYTINDISYWSMLPSLSHEKEERERIGSKARIFAMCGTFFVAATIVPITEALENHFGSLHQGFFVFTIIIVLVMLSGQMVTIVGVKEPKHIVESEGTTSLREMFGVIYKNDQLLVVAISMALFMIGYVTTVSFGIFYFSHVFGDVGMFFIFTIVLGVSQITSLAVVPYICKVLKRKTVYLYATLLVVSGYVIFFFAPTNTMIFIGIAGVLIFVGQGAIQLLMLLFLADTVEYGHWKSHKRNDSITFSIQPLINKMGGAIAAGVVGSTLNLSGVTALPEDTLLTGSGLYIFKGAMFVFPLLCILIGFVIYHFKYIIDEKKYAQIIGELKARGEIQD